MIERSFRPKYRAASRRRGAAFLLLVMMVLIVITSATQWLLSSTVMNRKAELGSLRNRSLASAIDQATDLISDWDTKVKLPVNEATNERIEITANRRQTTLTAVWLRREIEIARLTRPFTPRWLADSKKQN